MVSHHALRSIITYTMCMYTICKLFTVIICIYNKEFSSRHEIAIAYVHTNHILWRFVDVVTVIAKSRIGAVCSSRVGDDGCPIGSIILADHRRRACLL